MTPERFRMLLQTYGANLQRWPQTEQIPAHALLEQRTPELQQLLAEAEALDGWLDSHTVAVPDDALTRRVVAGADALRPKRVAFGKRRWRPFGWWAGAGLFGAGLAGTLAGAFVVSFMLRATPSSPSDWPERGTAFSAIPADWSEE